MEDTRRQTVLIKQTQINPLTSTPKINQKKVSGGTFTANQI